MSANPYAPIFGAARRLGLDHEALRDVFERETGVRSLKAMTDGQRQRVLAALNRDAPRPAASATRASGKYAGKLQALWIAGHNLGVVRKPDDGAMISFVKRQTGLDHTRFLQDAADAKKAIEALKDWLRREGGVDWSAHLDPRAAVLWAIFQRMVAVGGFKPFEPSLGWADIELWAWRARHAQAQCRDDYSKEDWIEVQNAAGRRLRAALAKERKPS